MSRSLKSGVDFFSLDVDFLGDDKIRLLKGEFSMKGISTVIALLCEIYRDEGYYKAFGEDQGTLLAESLGSEISPSFVMELVNGCCRRDFFDEAVFKAFGVLTSRSIQRRYLRAAAKRECIPIIKEYWLLDIENKRDVPAYIRPLVVFQNLSGTGKGVSDTGNQQKGRKNSHSKGKESNRKKEDAAPLAALEAFYAFMPEDERVQAALQAFAAMRAESKHPLTATAAAHTIVTLQKLADTAAVQDRGGYIAAALYHSVECNYRGVFAPKEFEDAPSKPVRRKAASYAQDIAVSEDDDLASML